MFPTVGLFEKFMQSDTWEDFPLSKNNKVKGSRRLAREKVLQILTADNISDTSLDILFSHIFFRKFNLNENVSEKADRLLKPDEIMEMEADVPISWKDDDIEFAQKLITKTNEKAAYYDELISDYAKNWKLERIALIDRILIHMAITELLNFPDIPPKVSVNEAIDIAKKYSTDKSSLFINGILDALLVKFRKDKTLKKSGRGLIEK